VVDALGKLTGVFVSQVEKVQVSAKPMQVLGSPLLGQRLLALLANIRTGCDGQTL